MRALLNGYIQTNNNNIQESGQTIPTERGHNNIIVIVDKTIYNQ